MGKKIVRLKNLHNKIATETKKAKTISTTAKKHKRQLFDILADTYALYEIITNPKGEAIDAVVIDLNEESLIRSGRKLNEIIGKPIREVFPQLPVEFIEKMAKVTVSHQPARFEFNSVVNDRIYEITLFAPNSSKKNQCALLGRDITDRKQMEEKLKSTERKLLLHLQQNLLGVIEWDCEFRVSEWNPAATGIFGFGRDEVIGRHAFELMVPKEIIGQIESVWQILTSQKRPGFSINENVKKNGDRIMCHWFNTPLTDNSGQLIGVMSLIYDITERKQAEKALYQSKEMFYKAFDNIPITITLNSINDGKYIEINKAFERVTGYQRDEVIGRSDRDLGIWVRDEDRDEVYRALSTNGRLNCQEAQIRIKSGETRFAQISAEVITYYEGESCILLMAEDITDKLRDEKLLIESEKMAATGQLAARIAHEINNPLAGIKNSFMLIKEGVAKDNPYRNYISKIEHEIDRIAKIVHQMYGLYKPSGFTKSKLALMPLIQDICELLQPTCAVKEALIELEVQQLLPEIYSSEGVLRQILFNIIKNAIEAADQQSKIKIAIETDNGQLQIAITNSGNTISEADHAKIFEPFYTTKHDSETGGLGLGLSISKNLAESIGGSIYLHNSEGNQTTFKIVLPQGK
jgi:PAS domain S-box-containing protein